MADYLNFSMRITNLIIVPSTIGFATMEFIADFLCIGLKILKRPVFLHFLTESNMIQRIQSLYMLLVVILNAVLVQWAELWSTAEGTSVFMESEFWVALCFYSIAALALIGIMLFKKRQNQFVINRLNIILNLFLLGFFVYRSLNLSGEMQVSEKGIGMLIPVFSIVLLVLANKAIKKDEDLVKSVDRLR